MLCKLTYTSRGIKLASDIHKIKLMLWLHYLVALTTSTSFDRPISVRARILKYIQKYTSLMANQSKRKQWQYMYMPLHVKSQCSRDMIRNRRLNCSKVLAL